MVDVSDLDLGPMTERLLAQIPDLIKSTSSEMAARLLKDLRTRWAKHSQWERRTRDAFERRLALRWAHPFKLLGMFLTIARESAGNTNTYLRTSKGALKRALPD